MRHAQRSKISPKEHAWSMLSFSISYGTDVTRALPKHPASPAVFIRPLRKDCQSSGCGCFSLMVEVSDIQRSVPRGVVLLSNTSASIGSVSGLHQLTGIRVGGIGCRPLQGILFGNERKDIDCSWKMVSRCAVLGSCPERSTSHIQTSPPSERLDQIIEACKINRLML